MIKAVYQIHGASMALVARFVTATLSVIVDTFVSTVSAWPVAVTMTIAQSIRRVLITNVLIPAELNPMAECVVSAPYVRWSITQPNAPARLEASVIPRLNVPSLQLDARPILTVPRLEQNVCQDSVQRLALVIPIAAVASLVNKVAAV